MKWSTGGNPGIRGRPGGDMAHGVNLPVHACIILSRSSFWAAEQDVVNSVVPAGLHSLDGREEGEL